MAPSPASGWSPPSGAAFKVSTDGEGITRITRAGLQAAGIADADIDAINLSRVQLFNLGAEQAHPRLRPERQRPAGRGRPHHLLRRGRALRLPQVRSAQRVLADRRGQREPPAHGDGRRHAGRRRAGGLAPLHGAPRAGPGLPAVGGGAGCDGPLDLLVDRDGRGVCGRRGGQGLHAVPARGAGDGGSDHPHVQPLRPGARDERCR